MCAFLSCPTHPKSAKRAKKYFNYTCHWSHHHFSKHYISSPIAHGLACLCGISASLHAATTAPRCRLALSQLLLPAFVFTLLPLAFLFLLELLLAALHTLLQPVYSCLWQRHWRLGFDGFNDDFVYSHRVFTPTLFMNKQVFYPLNPAWQKTCISINHTPPPPTVSPQTHPAVCWLPLQSACPTHQPTQQPLPVQAWAPNPFPHPPPLPTCP